MAAPTQSWEDLRKQARYLENELELKLVSFSKLGSSYSTSLTHHDSDKSPLLGGSNSDHMFEAMCVEIEQLLQKLTETNDAMSELVESERGAGAMATNPPPALLHTLQRHRDIRQDYAHEYKQTKANHAARRQREDLLGSVRRDIDAYKNTSGTGSLNNRKQDLYLKEHEHIKSSTKQIDDHISIAMTAKENLMGQRNILKKVNYAMNTLANKYPMINNLIQKTNLRKRRDSIILGAIISILVLFMLLYAFH